MSFGCKFTQLQYYQILLKSVNIWPSNHKNKNGELTFEAHCIYLTYKSEACTFSSGAEDESWVNIRMTKLIDGDNLQLIEWIWHKVIQPVIRHWSVAVLGHSVPGPVFQRFREVVCAINHQHLHIHQPSLLATAAAAASTTTTITMYKMYWLSQLFCTCKTHFIFGKHTLLYEGTSRFSRFFIPLCFEIESQVIKYISDV